MNILHVLSQFEVTGAETFAATLANEQMLLGHTVFIISDTFHTKTTSHIIEFPIGKRNFSQRYKNISFLKKIIQEKNIDVVHAHSRAASWVSFFATRNGETPLVSTVHGRQHVHFSSMKFHIYGEKVIPVCSSIYFHLNKELNYPIEKMRVIQNGINLADWKYHPKSKSNKVKRIGLVGRLSGPKGDVVKKIISEVFPIVIDNITNVELHIVGGMAQQSEITEAIKACNVKNGNRIIQRGYLSNLNEVYREFDLIMGSGRVAMESLACGIPVIAIGESNYVGLINELTKANALSTNFGDAGKKELIDVRKISTDIIHSLNSSSDDQSKWGRTFVKQEYDIKKKINEIQIVYAEARAEKIGIHEIPILMYHRVTEGKPLGTKHGIYVTKDEFRKQLQFFKEKGFTTLNFNSIKNIIRGKEKIPRKPLMLTFDDGYEDNFLIAFPLLKKYGMTAVIFLIANPEIRSNVWDAKDGEPTAALMSDDQIKQMMEYGIEFGSHTVNHKRLTFCTPEEAEIEIHESKKILEDRFGKKFISFAYPYGALHEEHKLILENSGYSFGIATDSGRKNFWLDLFKIRRIPIFPETSKFQLWKKTSGWYHWYKNVY